MDTLLPEYNLCKFSNSSLGYKHLESTKTKISNKIKGANHPLFGKELTEESKKKIGESLKYYYSKNTSKRKSITLSLGTKQKLALRCVGVKVDVFNKENKFLLSFPTIRSAAKYYNISPRTMGRRINKGYCNNYNYITHNSKLD
jgi:group I intron endonuclease